jgi:hypothetical protein
MNPKTLRTLSLSIFAVLILAAAGGGGGGGGCFIGSLFR